MEPDRLRAVLARTPGLESRHLMDAVGATTPGLNADLLEALLRLDLPRRARDWLTYPDQRLIDADLRSMEANCDHVLCCLDPGHPQVAGVPATLYVRGSPRPLARPALCMVGAPHASAAGTATARQFALELSGAGLSIMTGLADGIDAAAQEGALASGAGGIGICAAALDCIHPAGNARLAGRISAAGCLVSLFPPGTPPRRYHFPLRNRLLAALATGVLAVEANDGGGALRVAELARELRRPLFAVPGSIRDPHSRACNQLIRGGASLVQQPGDLLQDLNFPKIQQVSGTLPRHPQASPLDNKYEMLLDAAGFEPVDIDVLASRTGWPGHAVASMLLVLELQGRVAPQPGGRYCRLS